MDVHNTSVSGPSSVQLPAPDPSLNVCDPRATIWFLLRSSHVCSSRTAPYRLGLRCTATTILLSVYLPFQRHEVRFHWTTVEVSHIPTVSVALSLSDIACHRRVVSHHRHRTLRQLLLLPDLVSLLTFLVDCVSPAHSHLWPRVVVCGVCSITAAISPYFFGLVRYTCFHWFFILACF
ncbi:hypothetical protein ACOSQ2_025738 [Xanthoceras sorbifolium]